VSDRESPWLAVLTGTQRARGDRRGARRGVPAIGGLPFRLGCNGSEHREPGLSVEASEMAAVPRAELDALKAEPRAWLTWRAVVLLPNALPADADGITVFS
jgi:hypothetical protein